MQVSGGPLWAWLIRQLVQDVGELDRQLDGFANLRRAGGVRARIGFAQLVEDGQQVIEVLGNELLAERRILARPLELFLGDHNEGRHGISVKEYYRGEVVASLPSPRRRRRPA